MKAFKFRYFIPALLLAFALGCVFTGCQAQPAQAEQPIAKPETYFTEPEIIEEPSYNPCNDPYLQYEQSIESQQRKQQCGIKE